MANDTAYFYSRDIGCIWRVAEALEYGIEAASTAELWAHRGWRTAQFVAPVSAIMDCLSVIEGVRVEYSKWAVADF